MSAVTQTTAAHPLSFLTPQAPSARAIVLGALTLYLSGDERLATPNLLAKARSLGHLAEEHNLALGPALVAPLFTNSVDVPGQEMVYRFMPMQRDPSWREGGRFFVPPPVATRLHTLRSAGVRPDTLYIAHELTPSVAALPSAYAEDYMRPVAPRARLEEAQQLGRLAQGVGRVGFGALAGAGMVAGGVLSAALALSAFALDPVIVGAFADPQYGLHRGAPALWVPLVAWRY